MKNNYYVYIILCKNSSYYTGSTNDIEKRFLKHKSGKGARYTKLFLVDSLITAWELENKSEALSLEHFIKSLDRHEKQKFIDSVIYLKKSFYNKRLKNIKIKKVRKLLIDRINTL